MGDRLDYLSTTPMSVLPPGEDLADGTRTSTWCLGPRDSLSLFDPGKGGRAALFAMLDATRKALESYCVAEHENALHLAGPEVGCPVCEREQADDDAGERPTESG